MLGIANAIYKSKEFVEGHTFESNKQTIVVKDQHRVKIDEVSSNGTINQQVVVAYDENTDLINKLENLTPYQKVNFVVDIIYYKGALNKIVVLDVLDSNNEVEVVSNIFKRYAN